jgi:hypothetical protein
MALAALHVGTDPGLPVTFFDLALRTSASLHPGGPPNNLVSEYAGVIRAEGDGAPRTVGRAHALRVHADLASRQGACLAEVCGAHSRELGALHCLLYEPGQYHFRQDVVEQFDALDFDCLVLGHIVLDPRWRGLHLGLLAVRRLVDLLGGGCGLAVWKIRPPPASAGEALRVPRSWLPRHRTAGERRAAARRLRGYYGRMGFRRVGGTAYHGLSIARPAPSLTDLLGPVP